MIKAFIVFSVFYWATVASYAINIYSNYSFVFMYVNDEFKPTVNKFYTLLEKECPKKVVNESKYYTIKFSSGVEGGWIGLCTPGVGTFMIEVDKDWWDTRATNADKEQLLFHELSHCVIYRPHIEDKNNYMYPQLWERPAKVTHQQLVDNMKAYCNE